MLTSPLNLQPPTDTIWYGLLHYYLFLGFAAGTIALTFMVYYAIHNRERKGETRPAPKFEKHEGEWGNWKGTMMILLVTGSVLAFVEFQTFASTGLVVPPGRVDPIHIEVIGRQWDWIFVYPNGVQVIGNLTVPEGEDVLLNVTSLDVVHSFDIPALSVAKDAVPGHFNALWFNATQLGSYLIICKEFCGVGHYLMTGTLTVLTPSAYNQWYSSLLAPNNSGAGSNETGTAGEASDSNPYATSSAGSG
jgi:heme/copper-type cytochrome/quinol oxidase subunit 2